jgi:hypothetical protein
MKLQFSLAASLLLIVAVCYAGPESSANTSAAVETRCGWFVNPTPANAWLDDREGEWLIGVQGGHQAEGDWPEFKPSQWKRTNGNYGYGCACLQVTVNKQTHDVLEIKSARAKELAQCRRDPALKKWNGKLD